MDVRVQKKQAKAFIERWRDRGNERQDSQSFWLDLLQSVYGIEKPSEYIKFEDKVMLDNSSFFDGYIDKTRICIGNCISSNWHLCNHNKVNKSQFIELSELQVSKR